MLVLLVMLELGLAVVLADDAVGVDVGVPLTSLLVRVQSWWYHWVRMSWAGLPWGENPGSFGP